MRRIVMLLASAVIPVLSLCAASVAPGKVYVCPECGQNCDKLTFDKPGKCSGCGMDLIEQAEREKNKPISVAVLLFDGVEIIDYSGPWEVFGQAGFKVHTVAQKRDSITAVFGQKLLADYTFENSPKADILLVPGGSVAASMDNPELIKWIQANAKDAKYVMSVCSGAFLLSQAGLLDGLSATTVMGRIEQLAKASPKTKVVHDQRYVDNGKVITTAGLSSGIDGALHLLSKIQGRGAAQATALGMEYRWDPESRFARAALSDRYLPDLPDLQDATLLSYEGDVNQWQVQALVSQSASPAALIDMVSKRVATSSRHTRGPAVVSAANKSGSAGSEKSAIQWTLTADDGDAWQGAASAEPSPDHPGKTVLKITLARQGAAVAPAHPSSS